MRLMFSASAILDPPSAQKWSKILKCVGSESRGCEVRVPSHPHLTEKRGTHSPPAMPLLPVSLQLPSSSSTQSRLSAEHSRKGKTVSSAHLLVPHPHCGPRSSRLGSRSWRSGMLNPMWLNGLCIPVATTSLQSHPNPSSTQIQAVCALPREGDETCTAGAQNMA